MSRIVLVLILMSFVYAKVEIFGLKLHSDGNITVVEDGILIKDNMIVSAKRLTYDRLHNKITASKNVYINYDKDDYILSNKVQIDLNTTYITAKPFFYLILLMIAGLIRIIVLARKTFIWLNILLLLHVTSLSQIGKLRQLA
ncbi:MAG: hypothetical protein GXO40_03165 [Epsilonproteobacteria bacterium]|nr:hypothetical protein [Campylobacterota bacterium]